MRALLLLLVSLSGVAEPRTWTDSTGKFKTEAVLGDFKGDTLYLLRGGNIKAVPFARLSTADQGYLRSLYQPQVIEGEVVGLADGDTLTVLDDTKTQTKIRLEGIDAPESSQDFGSKARDALARKVMRLRVRVEWLEKDKYGRTLGHVFQNGKWINKELLEEGFAWHYKEYNDSPVLADAEVRAREAKLGLWSQPDPIAPWDFRHPPTQARAPPVVASSLAPSSSADDPFDVAEEPKADEPETTDSETVFITRSGTKYHRAGCRYLSKSSIPIDLAEVGSRYSPCSVCNPPLAPSARESVQAHPSLSGARARLFDAPEDHGPSASEATVYVTKSGKKYHQAGCRYLRGGGTAMPLSEAIARYSPCSVCHPPTQAESNESLAENQRKYVPATPRRSSTYTPPATSTPTESVDRNPYGETPTGQTATGIPVYTGPRGGHYHYSKSGKKVYERKR